ncbi:uncharacterized protein [Anabrus simplex]|uniref:uncharacterized protein n=1 Tax=Anabrus simplex TaxID=316456 RepID=UPI0034DD6DAA
MPVDTPGGREVEKQQQERLLSPVPIPLELRRQSVRAFSRKRKHLKGPWRALRLCLLGILLPSILVAVPLYMRYHVYGDQMYPVAMSDMRLLDSRVSTTWCQRQLVKGNTTFNAFLLPEQPKVDPEPVRLSMTRDLWLEDDAKEYWAFYLLKGSAITVSTCVRGPGASLIVIRGHKHLHDCAYIGDDSSEELDELEQAAEEAAKQDNLEKGGQWPLRNSTEARSNEPRTMRRARPGVSFHSAQPLHSGERLSHHDSADGDEDTDKMLGHLLGKVAQARLKAAPEVPPQPRRRLPIYHHPKVIRNTSTVQHSPVNVTNNANLTSSEVFEDVLRKLQKLGPRGKSVLRKLNKQLGGKGTKNGAAYKDDGLEALREVVRQVLKEEDAEPVRSRHQKSRARKQDASSDGEGRNRRHITLSSPLAESLTEHDEDGDVALESLEPDGIADHHQIVNETTAGDFSKSEFWSSFSSSEEALLSCAGLILNLPLTPHHRCEQHQEYHVLSSASLANKLTYKVPRNGYYFFVFNSENEIEQNYIHTHFEIEKMVYNVSNSMDKCNSTEECSLALDFFSSEKVVLEVPIPSNESLWDEEYVVVSTCEPRTAIYISCVVAVPLLIVLFAFQ